MENGKLEIDKLRPTQFHVRDIESVIFMSGLVSNGSVFDKQTVDELGKIISRSRNPLISVCRFEDEVLYIRDGHHRIASIFLGGRIYLHESEYVIEDRKYSDFTEISEDAIKAGWITPFDPREEIRKADFLEYKKNVPTDLKEAVEYISNGWKNGLYSVKRKDIGCVTLKDYIDRIQDKITDHLWQ
jgi:hypothetical protein